MKSRCYACFSLVRRHTRGNEYHFIQCKELQHAARNFKMPVVHRIERSPVDAYAAPDHGTHARELIRTSSGSAGNLCARCISTSFATARINCFTPSWVTAEIAKKS